MITLKHLFNFKHLYQTHGWEGVVVGCAFTAAAVLIVLILNEIVSKFRGANRFPSPPTYNLTWDQFQKYSHDMPPRFAHECQWIVYRLDPARAPFPSILKTGAPPDEETIRRRMYPDEDYWRDAPRKEAEVYEGTTPADFLPTATFIARIQRTWKNEAGLRESAEICVCHFQIGQVAGSVPGEPARIL